MNLEIVSDSTDCEVFDIPKGCELSVRSQGTRWISRKTRDLQRVISRYGIYIHHLGILPKDKSISGKDRVCIVTNLKKWQHSDKLISCAYYIDILKSPLV